MHHNLIIKDGDTTKVVKEVLVDGVQFVDEKPIEGSVNSVTSGGVAAALKDADDKADGIDTRLETVEGVIPSGASESNKVVTASDLAAAEAGWQAGYTPKGPASVSTINGLTGQQNGDVYTLTDGGTVNPGALTVSAGDQIAWDATNSIWYKFIEYATKKALEEVDQRLNPNYKRENCWLNSSNKITNVGSSGYYTIFVYVKGVTSVKVTPQTGKNAVIRFLKSYPVLVNNTPLPLASTPGSSVNVETTFTLSSDAEWMFIGQIYNNYNYFPSSVTFDGVEYENFIHDSYEKLREGVDKIITPKIVFHKTDSTHFYVLQLLKNGKYLKINWQKEKWTSTYNDIPVVDSDCWVSGNIYIDNAFVGQSNINFIYSLKEEENGTPYTYYVGAGHGCCVDKQSLFFIDGKIIDYSSLSNGQEINGNEFRILSISDCYVSSKERTEANGGSGNKVYCKVDENGVPILSTIWTLDFSLRDSGSKHLNRLTVMRDAIKFIECFGAMNSTQPNEFDHLVLNDKYNSSCSWTYEDNEHIITPIYGTEITSGQGIIQDVTKVTQYGSNYSLTVECRNLNKLTYGNVKTWFEDGGNGRAKMYIQPVKTILSDGEEGAEVFNINDKIECLVIRNFE